MGGIRFSFPASVIAGKGRIDRHDFLILRKYTFADGISTYDDALLMLALNDMCPARCDEWPTYFIETLSAFIVDGSSPTGRIDLLKSAWLIQTLAVDGAVDDPLHLEFLLHAIERAGSCPEILSAFALDQLRLAFCDEPCGAYRMGRPHRNGIAAYDIAYVWRILRNAVDGGRLFLSPLEASILNMINGLVEDRDNHPGWADIMEHVSGGRGADSLRRRPWLRTPDMLLSRHPQLV
ncbi:hypothetical protein SAMN03159496_03206 [Rhizobium sp. NFR07]|uniref:hypothetical protein n=1 Tax=Rhizobium sp. NFR07 TaxID=1566262 RepID=UPI0008E17B1F|nr:hypothetical protein [Rhizobium sp. NFR07]SFB37315.1 hypothetical protein SAMN03159496_03206 [Rhizobium sp. NFR07]